MVPLWRFHFVWFTELLETKGFFREIFWVLYFKFFIQRSQSPFEYFWYRFSILVGAFEEKCPTLTVGSFLDAFIVHLFNNLNYGGSKHSNLRNSFVSIFCNSFFDFFSNFFLKSSKFCLSSFNNNNNKVCFDILQLIFWFFFGTFLKSSNDPLHFSLIFQKTPVSRSPKGSPFWKLWPFPTCFNYTGAYLGNSAILSFKLSTPACLQYYNEL